MYGDADDETTTGAEGVDQEAQHSFRFPRGVPTSARLRPRYYSSTEAGEAHLAAGLTNLERADNRMQISPRRKPSRLSSALFLILSAALCVAPPDLFRRFAFAAQSTSASSDRRPNYAAHALIRRDLYGVPHILADTEEAAAYAHGYATAEDHGGLLARAFLRARGMQASVLGRKYVDEDVLNRTLRIYDMAVERFKDLPPFMQAIMEGYAAGYNDYLTQHRTQFPEWATPVTGTDVLAHARATMLLDFGVDPAPWQMLGKDKASNMWAIGPTRSASGSAMLLANPHLGWEAEVPLQEVHLTVPGLINVIGAAMIGIPVVSIGFNDTLGWSHTVNFFRAHDVYELTLDDAGTSYSYDGRWLPLTPQTFTIQVRDGDQVKAEDHTILQAHYGPVIRRKGEKAYAYKSSLLETVNFVTQYNLMGKAASLRDFTAAVYIQQIPIFNIVYADKVGNIWYLFNGRIPIRPVGYNGETIPGNTSKSEWFAVWPIPTLPQLLNPKSGYVQNCNDAPWYANLEQDIKREPFAEYLPYNNISWRGMMSLKILSSEKSMTLEKLMAYKYNAHVLLAERVKKDLIASLRDRGDEWREAADILERWDNSTQADSRGATLFFAWWNDYSRAVRQPFRIPFDPSNVLETPAGIADPIRAIESFRRAVTSIKERQGALDTLWGATHRARRGNLDLPLGGSDLTLLRTFYRRDKDGKDVALGGDAYALAVEFGDTPRAFSVIPYSQASSPQSPYYNNQLQLYADRKFKPLWFSEQDIVRNLGRQYRPGQ